ncbi:adenylate/guanylate cyclase domain-containing protein [Limibaculum sp. M0105]|uniref:Adenylate/guanylate cyclase domain-containing protein n=2 Tax=Thermohalobaculum xanthum TaxID=2753746 RepID=A0A8J7M5R8_9RHOB|nr:adenylate/guanylate cyclase domain-containing protein [Thermohalobaculum xanthum]
MREGLQQYSDDRRHGLSDPRPDEIGSISGAMAHYMEVIDHREAALAEKTRELEALSNQLAKYLSPQVYDSIFTGKQEVKVASSRKKLTIFFSDVVGFTETADRLESEELTQILNQYLTEMSRIALRHGATIDKFVGDAVMAFFGDPDTRGVREDAVACVRMAMEMRDRLCELQWLWREAGIERPLQARMGIHTGYCTVGNFGSEDRLDYTIIGSAVNIASRLEAMAAPGEILLSFETFAHVNGSVACEPRGEVEVKGVAYPVATYRVIAPGEIADEGRGGVHQHGEHLRLDLNINAMSPADRAAARASLKHAIDMLDLAARAQPAQQDGDAEPE